MPDAQSTRGLACSKKTRELVTTGTPEANRHSLHNGFNGFLRALPGDRALLPPSPLRSSLLRDLNASVGASGPHDFAVRESRRSSCGALASIAFRTQRP
jgi:hypothetical protein